MKKNSKNKKKIKCIVTGGAGFIGSHVVDLLISKNMDVIIIDDLSSGRKENINPRAKFVKADIRKLKNIKPFFKKADYVFHLAALPRIQPSFEEPVLHEEANVIGAVNCLLACKGNKNLKKFVFSGSSAVYGNPRETPTGEEEKIKCLSPYALQKYAGEQYCLILGKRYNIPVISLRYFNVYGPRSFNHKNPFNAYSSVVGIFENQKKEGNLLTITGSGKQSRDFVHVEDVAMANFSAAKSDFKNEIYNIGCGKNYSVNQVAKMFGGKYVYIAERKGEARITLADISKAKKMLKWKPIIKIKEYIKIIS